MSKFIDELQCIETNLKYARPTILNYNVDVVDDLAYTSYPVQYQYEARAEFVRRFICTVEEKDRLMEQVSKQLKRVVYGDLIEELRDIYFKVYERNYTDVELMLTDLIHKIE